MKDGEAWVVEADEGRGWSPYTFAETRRDARELAAIIRDDTFATRVRKWVRAPSALRGEEER